MITSEQIKAARALLNWKQSTLAEKSGISLPSINNVERAIGSPRTNTLEAIQKTLENAGVEFIAGRGVCLKDEIFEIHKFEGEDFIKKQYDDLLPCMENNPDEEIIMCSIDERMYPKYVAGQMMRYDVLHRRIKWKERILIRQDDTYFLANPKVYRWIAPELVGTIPYMVYKDRFTMMMWEERRVIIIRNQSIADTFRRQFDFLWNLAKPVPSGHVNKLDDQDFIKDLDI